MTAVTNIPDWRITLDGKDLTSRMSAMLMDLPLSEQRSGEADQLDITLSDHAGTMAIPKPRVHLHHPPKELDAEQRQQRGQQVNRYSPALRLTPSRIVPALAQKAVKSAA